MSRVCVTFCQPTSNPLDKHPYAVCGFCTQARLSQPTAHPANTSLCCMWYSRAGFVIWHRQNRWPLLCLQGSPAAHAKLGELLASHTALTAPRDPLTTKIGSDGDGLMSPSQPAQQKQHLTASREDIVSLNQAMLSRFGGRDLASVNMPGFGTFGDIALAFGLPHIYEGFLQKKLEVNPYAAVLIVISSIQSLVVPAIASLEASHVHGMPCSW